MKLHEAAKKILTTQLPKVAAQKGYSASTAKNMITRALGLIQKTDPTGYNELVNLAIEAKIDKSNKTVFKNLIAKLTSEGHVQDLISTTAQFSSWNVLDRFIEYINNPEANRLGVKLNTGAGIIVIGAIAKEAGGVANIKIDDLVDMLIAIMTSDKSKST